MLLFVPQLKLLRAPTQFCNSTRWEHALFNFLPHLRALNISSLEEAEAVETMLVMEAAAEAMQSEGILNPQEPQFP
jgi:hypothetical protein